MKLALQVNGKESILKIKGVNRLYVLNHEMVYNSVVSQLERNYETVKLDLKAIQYIDSSAFNTLVKLHKYALDLDKQLVILNVSPAAMGLFQILRLNEVLNFDDYIGNEVWESEEITA